MTLTTEKLTAIWQGIRDYPAWLSKIVERVGLDARDEAYLNELEDRHRENVKALREEWSNGRSLVLGEISEWGRELGEWAKERRKEYLDQEIQNLSREIDAIYRDYADAAAQDQPDRFLILSGVHDLEKRRDRLSWELKALSGKVKQDGLELYQIEKARTYPLENLVETRKSWMLCPLHKDRHPSMLVKNGFGYCFSCGGHLDSIGYMMQVRGLTFRQAVEALQ